MTSPTERPSVASPFDLTGRTALVTGAGTGIGQAIAVALAAAGAELILTSEQDNLAETTACVEEHTRVLARERLDLRDGPEVPRTAARLLAAHRVDILVNAAGIIRRQQAADFTDENWREVLEVNLTAAFRLSREVARPMLERGSGKILNVASMLSFQGGRLVTSYAASKHGLVGLTRAMATEWAPYNVQVNAVAPGYIVTRTTEELRADPARSAEILGRIPAGRWGTPADVGAPAVFLAAPASDYVTGHVLTVDGGWMAG